MTSDNEDIRVGVDLARVSDIESSIARYGERYLRHVFTTAEQEQCSGSPRHLAEGLAARFAAKEATIKVLRPAGIGGLWTSIEVRRQPSGAAELHLHDVASALANEAGIERISLSLAHEGDIAVAVVVAIARPRPATDTAG